MAFRSFIHRFMFAVLVACVFSAAAAITRVAMAEEGAADLGARPASAESAASVTEIEVFVREGCPHCAKAKEFLAKLAKEHPEIRILLRDVHDEPAALERLQQLAKETGNLPRVPAFWVGSQLIVGFSDEATTGEWLRNSLKSGGAAVAEELAGTCGPESEGSCEAQAESQPKPEPFVLDFLGHRLELEQTGLPLFTLAMGLLDGFNPCSMWVLLLMISLLVPMRDRKRMLIIAGAFVAVEGVAYYVFMAAWLNLFLFIGLSRISEIVIAAIALLAGGLNLKDAALPGRGGPSLSIPDSAKPGIYARMRAILQAKNLTGAVIGAVVLAVLVQIVEFLCTSGFPALYTRILTLHALNGWAYYGYLLLYNLAYMLDDVVVLGVGVVTLSQHRLQEKEGRLLKLISGVVMIGLGLYLLIVGQA